VKVAHVFPSQAWGGAEIYVIWLAQAQKNAGLDVLVWGKADSPMIEEAKRRGLATLTDFIPYRLGLRHTANLAKVIEREGITHLHGHWSGSPWSFWRIKKYCAVRVIYHIHLWISVFKADPLHALVYRQLDAVIVAGPRARSAARALLPLRDEQIHICPYMLEEQRFAQLHLQRDDLGLPEDALILGMFTRLDPQKGVKEFALALQQILPRYPQAAAILMGDPTRGEAAAAQYAEEVEQILAANPANNRIFRFPFRPDYLEVLRNCDVMVSLGYNESYSLTILDAFALGVSVVATNAGGTPDLVPPSRGWLIEPKSLESLTTTLDKVCQAPEVVHLQSRATQDYVHQEHSSAAVLKRIMATYQGAAPEPSSKGLLITCLSDAWGGLEMVASEMAIEFQAHGYAVAVACYSNSPLEESLKAANIPYRAIEREAGHWRRTAWLRQCIAELEPESVLINRLPELKVVVPALLGKPKVRLVALSHMLVNYNKKDVFHRYLYSRIDQMIVLTEHHKANQLKFLPIASDKIEVIPDWISCKANVSVDSAPIKEHFDADLRHLPVAVMASRLDPQKGQDVAIQALGHAEREGRPFLLAILGESTRGERDVRADLQALAKREGVERLVRFLGYRENIFPYLQAADYVLVPSREETFGRVIIEAMHLGTPVVASNRGGPTCIIDHLHSGLLFKPECPRDLEEQIHALNSDHGLHASIAKNAKEKSKIFSKDVVFERLAQSIMH
jgi:glycosyltransferase involved in cell wall biosynthesis